MPVIQGKPVDGVIHHFFQGKQIDNVTKDGTFVYFHFTNGQTARLAWLDPNKGEPIKGEPMLYAVDVKIQLAGLDMEGSAELNGHLYTFGNK